MSSDEFSFDALQRQLAKDGYGAQAKNTKEVGAALKLAGATQVRRNLGGQKARRYALANERQCYGSRGSEVLKVSKSLGCTSVHPVLLRNARVISLSRRTGLGAGSRSISAPRSFFLPWEPVSWSGLAAPMRMHFDSGSAHLPVCGTS